MRKPLQSVHEKRTAHGIKIDDSVGSSFNLRNQYFFQQRKSDYCHQMSEQRKTLEELMKQLGEVNHRTGFKARELEVDEHGAILLDPSNPNDVEWYENDEAYDND